MRRNVWLSVLIGLALVSTIVPTATQSLPIQYGHTWGTADQDFLAAVDVDSAGNIFLAGYQVVYGGGMADGFIAKVDSFGSILWDMSLSIENGQVTITDISVSETGDLYILGTYYDPNGGMTSPRTFYGKVTSSGSLVYAYGSVQLYDPLRIAADSYSDGFVFTTSWSQSTDGTVFSVADSGVIRWSLGADSVLASAWGLLVDGSGNSYAFCDRYSNNYNVGIVKFSPNGQVIRQVLLDAPLTEDYTWDLALASDGSVYALGEAFSEGLMILVKFNSNLDALWSEYVGDPLIYHESTRLVISGGTLLAMGQVSDNGTAQSVYRLDMSGNLLEASQYGYPSTGADLVFTDAAAYPGGGVVIAGRSLGAPETTETQLTGVTTIPITDAWIEDSVSWAAISPSISALNVIASDPSALVDDYSPASYYQAWFGFIDTKAPTLVVDVTVTQHGTNGERVTFAATATNGTPKYTYEWNFGDGVSGSGQRITHTYSSGGIYSARVMVTDSVGEFGVATVRVVVQGPPVIYDTYITPNPAVANQTVYLETTASDPDGGPCAFYWDFGDGTSLSTDSSSVTHVYTIPGMYPITLTVTDDEGLSTTAGYGIEVLAHENMAPVASFMTVPTSPYAGEGMTFYGTSSYDPDGWIVSYSWWFGDGLTANSTVPWMNHTYAAAGTYYPGLLVTDNQGLGTYVSSYLIVQQSTVVSPDSYEPDDSWYNASSIALGASQTHTIHNDGLDVDWVSFQMNETAEVAINTFAPFYDTVIYLYDSAGVPTTPIAMDDDSGPGNNSQIVQTLAPGTYYVKVIEGGQDEAIPSYIIQVRLTTSSALWTFMVYEDGDNNLEDVALTDFMEMSSVGSNADINIVVQLDRNPWYSEAYGNWEGTKRFYVTPGMTPDASNAVEDLGELDMGSGQTLTDFVSWAMTNYPAQNYLLDLWDHGGGWDGAVCWDETDSMDALTLEELAQSLNESYMLTGDRIDVIGFDACLMGMAEVAYEIREWTDYLVFSEETIPWDGWPYDTVLSDLAAFPSMGPAEFSSSIVTRYMEYYGYNGAETMSALDVGAMGELYQAIDALGEAMIAELDNSSDAFAVARNYTQSFSEYSYIDLYDFAAQLIYYLPGGTLGSIPEWIQNIISVAVIAEGHGQYLPGANGLSIYFPTWWWSSQYDDLAFSIDLSWDDFLMSYLHVTPSGPDAYEPDDTFDQASWIEMNETQEHSISNSGADIDWVKFNITSPQVVAVYTSIPNNVFGDTVIALFNSSGVPYYPMATNDDYYNLSSLIQMYLTPDTYYVEVWSLGQYSEISTYYLTLSPALPNDPPVIYYVQWYPSLPYPGDYVYFEIGAYDPDGYIDHFEWDFGDGTGIWYAYSSWISHYFSSGGYYNGSVTAVDNQGGSTTMMLGINVVSPPVAVVTLPDVVKVGTPATFSGTDSYDPSGGIITNYWWWFSDGWNGSGPEVTRVFDSPGTYSLYLQVYSSTGRYGYTEVTFVVVTPLPPIAVASYSPSRPLVGETVIFDGSHSTDLDNGTIPTFIWEYGDGAVGEGLMATHAYSHAGTYQVKLTVVDEDNLVAVDTVSIVVVSSPVAAFEYSPASLPAGQEATFYAYGSYDESGISQCTWSFGDGTYAQGWQVSHKYSSAGTYEVKLTVQNSAGVTSSVMKSIVVSSKPAASGLGSPQEPVALSGSPVLVFDVMSASLLAGLLVSSLLLFVVSRRAKRPISEKLDR